MQGTDENSDIGSDFGVCLTNDNKNDSNDITIVVYFASLLGEIYHVFFHNSASSFYSSFDLFFDGQICVGGGGDGLIVKSNSLRL